MTCDEEMRAALEPCPFCGGEAEFVEEHHDHWRVRCSQCGIKHTALSVREDGDRQHLTEAWNTRATLSRPVDADVERASPRLARMVDEQIEREGDSSSFMIRAGLLKDILSTLASLSEPSK